jgi:hypothetical protein
MRTRSKNSMEVMTMMMERKEEWKPEKREGGILVEEET